MMIRTKRSERYMFHHVSLPVCVSGTGLFRLGVYGWGPTRWQILSLLIYFLTYSPAYWELELSLFSTSVMWCVSRWGQGRGHLVGCPVSYCTQPIFRATVLVGWLVIVTLSSILMISYCCSCFWKVQDILRLGWRANSCSWGYAIPSQLPSIALWRWKFSTTSRTLI